MIRGPRSPGGGRDPRNRRFLLLALALAACGRPAPLSRTPETLAGLPLHHRVTGDAALAAIARLHGRGPVALDSAWVAMYGTGGPSVMLYVGVAPDAAAAQRLVGDMRAAIRRRRTFFRDLGQRRDGGHVVDVFEGLGQEHYVFADGPRAVWLSADPAVAAAALDDALGVGAGLGR